jgi:hypothetical protein
MTTSKYAHPATAARQASPASSRAVQTLGFGSALLVALEVAAFAAGLSFSLPIEWSFVASFFLAPSFLTLMVSLHYSIPAEKQVWSHLGLVFATVYTVMVTISYFLQLAVVANNSLGVSEDALKLVRFVPGSAIFAQDMLGYSFMCLATLAAAPVFGSSRLERWLGRLFAVHGLLFAPTLVMTVLFPLLASGQPAGNSDWIGNVVLLGWSAIFIPLPILLSLLFRRGQQI